MNILDINHSFLGTKEDTALQNIEMTQKERTSGIGINSLYLLFAYQQHQISSLHVGNALNACGTFWK